MGWGKDNEERAAIAQKAQAGYAAARQAMEKATAADARSERLATELMEVRAEYAALSRRLDRLAAAFEAATEPVKRPTRKAA